MKTKGMVVMAVMLVALLTSVAAQAQEAQEALMLRYTYTAGATDKYVMKGAFEGAMSGGPQGEIPMDIGIEGALTVKTTAVSDKGVASQEIAIERMAVNSSVMGMESQMIAEGGKVTLLVNGQPMEMPEGTPGMEALSKPIKMKLDTRGNVVEMDISSLGDVLGGFDPSAMYRANTAFPEGPVSPGDSWSHSIKIPLNMLGQTTEMTMSFTYTFVGTEKYKGADVVRLSLKGTGELSTTGEGNTPFKDLTQSFSGYELFDFKAGRTPYTKVKMEQAMAGMPGSGEQDMSMTISGDLEVTLQ